MLGNLIEKRIDSLNEFIRDIDVVLQEMKLEAIDKSNQDVREEFSNFSKAVQYVLTEYKESLEVFIEGNQNFTFKDYELLYTEKDQEVLNLIQEYAKKRRFLETTE